MGEPNLPMTSELGATRLRLRDDLVFTPQLASGQSYYLVEDPLHSRFFRLGYAEYTFVSLLDGSTTTEAAVRRLATSLPDHELTEMDIAGLCRWLVDMDLVRPDEGGSRASHRTSDTRQPTRASRGLNPLLFRWPLLQPDRAFALCVSWFGWMFSPLALAGWLVLVLVGLWSVSSEWNRFVASSQGIFATSNWVWLAASWLVLKILHETGHGLACKRYGGSVREAGLLFVLLTPLAYVDVTSSWRFRSHWQRAHVAAAGMYVELAIAAVAAIAWKCDYSEWLNHLCFNTVVTASLATLLFNANPLMKFDGYYLLSDALNLPNLSTNAQAYLRHWARRFLLQVPSRLPHWSRRELLAVRAYAWCSLAWRFVVSISLIISASALFHGAGIVLSIAAGAAWFGVPALRFGKYLICGTPGEQPNRLRFLVLTGAACAIGVLFFGQVPWPGARTSPAVVEYAPHVVVRAACPGFVRQVCIVSGQQVTAGQTLLILENRDLVRDDADLALQIRQAEIRAHRHEQKGEHAARQAELKNREALLIQLAEKKDQVSQLEVRAPSAGTIVLRNPMALIGTYLKQGDVVLSLGAETHKELRISVAQEDVEAYRRRISQPLSIDFPRVPLWRAELEQVIPRAVREPPHAGMTTVNGGLLAVKATKSPADSEGQSSSSDFELLDPRFTAHVALSERDSLQLHSGQIGVVSCRDFQESIGQHLYYALCTWIRARANPTKTN